MNNTLAKGLSSLLGDKDLSILKGSSSDRYKNLPLEQIVVDKNQPRKQFDEKALNELSASIKEFGVLQPIIVKKIENNKFKIISGERRFRASLMAGLLSIPAIIQNYNDEKTYIASILENIQRENLNIVEEAKAYENLIDNYKYTQQQLATKLGKSRSHIANILRLLSLPKNILDALIDKKIEMGHARALINCKNAEEYLDYIIENNLSVRDVEKLVKSETTIKTEKKYKKDIELENILNEKANIFEKRIGLKCKINFNKTKKCGIITLHYSSIEDLNNILNNFKE